MPSESRWSIAVLASGRGSNLQALHQASLNAGLPIDIVGVFSDKANSGAIDYARQHHLPQRSLAPKDFADRSQFDSALMQAVASVKPQLIVCAGYMRIISPEGIAHAPCPMINIHPSQPESTPCSATTKAHLPHLIYPILCTSCNWMPAPEQDWPVKTRMVHKAVP